MYLGHVLVSCEAGTGPHTCRGHTCRGHIRVTTASYPCPLPVACGGVCPVLASTPGRGSPSYSAASGRGLGSEPGSPVTPASCLCNYVGRAEWADRPPAESVAVGLRGAVCQPNEEGLTFQVHRTDQKAGRQGVSPLPGESLSWGLFEDRQLLSGSLFPTDKKP